MVCGQRFELFLANAFWLTMLDPSARVFAQIQNVALDKIAQQTSTYSDHYAAKAVDGDMSTFSRTCNATRPYWMVDLVDVYTIAFIRIYTFVESYIYNVDVHIELSVDGTNYTGVCFYAGLLPEVYTCEPGNSYRGRWVKVVSLIESGTRVILKEVEVAAHPIHGTGKFTAIPSVKGTGPVLHTRPVVTYTQCAFLCTRNTNCVSVNVVNSNTGMECQLLGSNVYGDTNEEHTAFWKLD